MYFTNRSVLYSLLLNCKFPVSACLEFWFYRTSCIQGDVFPIFWRSVVILCSNLAGIISSLTLKLHTVTNLYIDVVEKSCLLGRLHGLNLSIHFRMCVMWRNKIQYVSITWFFCFIYAQLITYQSSSSRFSLGLRTRSLPLLTVCQGWNNSRSICFVSFHSSALVSRVIFWKDYSLIVVRCGEEGLFFSLAVGLFRVTFWQIRSLLSQVICHSSVFSIL